MAEEMSSMEITFTPPKGETEDGFDHYYEKSDSFFREFQGPATVADFEQAFHDFEEKYFQDLPPVAKITMRMAFPVNIRMMAALNRYTRKGP
jgi:hypothetical protein